MKKEAKEEKGAKPYLLKDALDPRGAKTHVEASSDALELEGDGQGRMCPRKRKRSERSVRSSIRLCGTGPELCPLSISS